MMQSRVNKCEKCNKKKASAFMGAVILCRECYDKLKWKAHYQKFKDKREEANEL